MYWRAIILITSFAFTIPVHAQSWQEQQQMYNDRSRMEVELFQQREEMERLKQEIRRQEQETSRQKSEQYQSLQEIKRENDEMLHQRGSEKISNEIKQKKYNYTQKEFESSLIQEMDNKKIKAENNKDADFSEFVLSNDYYANNMQTLLEKGFTLSEAKKLNDLHKNFVYRIGKSAMKGDPEAQFMLGIMYRYGFTKLHSLARLRELNKLYQLTADTPDLSPEEKREVIIDSIEAILEHGNDSAYVALCIPKSPIVKRDDGKALEWLHRSAEQKHGGALVAIQSMDDRSHFQPREAEK